MSSCNANSEVYVKDRLKKHIDYYENITVVNATVICVIKGELSLLLIHRILKTSGFVNDSVNDLSNNKLVEETNNIPHVKTLLSVVGNSGDKNN